MGVSEVHKDRCAHIPNVFIVDCENTGEASKSGFFARRRAHLSGARLWITPKKHAAGLSFVSLGSRERRSLTTSPAAVPEAHGG
jgi:hypothetical protein